MSPNGWTDDALCAEWFENSFIPQANMKHVSDAPILLIYDGHGSHATPRLVDLTLQNNIHLFCLPPHTTHKLQPLDVGVFGQLQAAWVAQCDEVIRGSGHEMRKQDIVKEYMAARAKAVKPELVQSAFKHCGMNLINPSVFGPADFAPSSNSSRHSHLPASYPCIPQHPSPLAASLDSAPAATHSTSVMSLHPIPSLSQSPSHSEDSLQAPFDADDNGENDFDIFSDSGSEKAFDADREGDSDDDWTAEYETDDDVLNDALDTAYARTQAPVLVSHADGSNLSELHSAAGNSSTSHTESQVQRVLQHRHRDLKHLRVPVKYKLPYPFLYA